MKKHTIVAVMAGLCIGALGGAGLVAQADDNAPPVEEFSQLSAEAVTSDWCGFIGAQIGKDRPVKSVTAVADAMIAGDATTADGVNPETAPNPDAAVAAAYLSLVEGEPDAIASRYATFRAAATEAVEGRPITAVEQASSAAEDIDAFLDANCQPGG